MGSYSNPLHQQLSTMSSLPQLVLLGAVAYGVYSMYNKSPQQAFLQQPNTPFRQDNSQVIMPMNNPANRAEMAADQIKYEQQMQSGQLPGQYGTLGGAQFW